MDRHEPYIGDGTPPPIREHQPERTLLVPIVIAAVVLGTAVAAAWYFWWRDATAPAIETQRAAVPATPSLPLAQAPRNPIDSPPADQPLPALKESDGPVAAALSAIVGLDTFGRLFVSENLVRNIVATVDNLPRESVASRLNPVKPVGGTVVTKGKDATLAIAPENAARYLPLVRLAQSLDAKRVAALYLRFYPLFQQAYEDLGYPGRYFNDRLVEAIDDMLAAPEIDKPIALVVPHVLYEYADPELESLSAGRKIMIRVGRGNEAILKAKLRELRQEIVAGAPQR